MVNLASRRSVTVGALGTAQTLSWASSYYLPAVLATPMAKELGVAAPTVFAAFSIALVVSAAVGPAAGRLIDRRGGRPVLMGTNVLFALGLVALGLAQGPVTLFLAWGLLGIAMGSGLYEAAFTALVRLYGQGARNAITGITLIAGFASTVGWPLSAWLDAQIGWRGACLVYAAIQVGICLPLLSFLLPTVRSAAPDRRAPAAEGRIGGLSGPRRHAFVLLAVIVPVAGSGSPRGYIAAAIRYEPLLDAIRLLSDEPIELAAWAHAFVRRGGVRHGHRHHGAEPASSGPCVLTTKGPRGSPRAAFFLRPGIPHAFRALAGTVGRAPCAVASKQLLTCAWASSAANPRTGRSSWPTRPCTSSRPRASRP